MRVVDCGQGLGFEYNLPDPRRASGLEAGRDSMSAKGALGAGCSGTRGRRKSVLTSAGFERWGFRVGGVEIGKDDEKMEG